MGLKTYEATVELAAMWMEMKITAEYFEVFLRYKERLKSIFLFIQNVIQTYISQSGTVNSRLESVSLVNLSPFTLVGLQEQTNNLFVNN